MSQFVMQKLVKSEKPFRTFGLILISARHLGVRHGARGFG